MLEQRHQVNDFKDFNEAVTIYQKLCIETNGTPKEMILREVPRTRNYSFHRKIFGLIDFAYKNTELPQIEYKGSLIKQSKERFREEIIILSGFYSTDVTRKGELRLMADSLSYTKCNQSKAEKIFDSMLNVVASLLQSSGYDRETLERLSNDWVAFT